MHFLTRWSQELLSALRIVSAFLFIPHGTMKLFNFPIAFPYGEVEIFSQVGLAGVLEVFGGLLLLIGLFTRPVAFVLSGMMAVAYFMSHATKGFWPIANGGELAVMYCFTFLYIAAAGGGKWSVDCLRGKT